MDSPASLIIGGGPPHGSLSNGYSLYISFIRYEGLKEPEQSL